MSNFCTVKHFTVLIFLFLSIITYTGTAQKCDKDKTECQKAPTENSDCGCSKLKRPGSAGATPSESTSATPAVETHTAADSSQAEAETEKPEEKTVEVDESVEDENDEDDEPQDSVEDWAEKYKAQANSPFPRTNQMSCLPGGTFTMGTDELFIPEDGEGPARHVTLKPFCMDVHEVSIAEFSLFVNATKHETVAEAMGDSFVVEYFVSNETKAKTPKALLNLPWWLPLRNASWKNPEGMDSNITNRMDHAVVHVGYEDAAAYCKWAGKRLPTEAEWEYACRGGLYDRLFPWGNLQQPRGEHRLNTWQGKFPYENTAEDGHASFGPVTAYLSQNKYGMKNMVGNAWEWVSDWWGTNFSANPEENPQGPTKGRDRVKKGGSFLCSITYCYRYRCAARSSNSPDTTAYNLGFRCAADKLPEYIPPYDVESVLKHEEEMRKAGKVIKSPDDWVQKVKRSHQNAKPDERHG